MRHAIPRPYHWPADYSYIPLVATAPETLGFSNEKAATTLCRVFSGGVLLSALFTRAEWGLVRVMPYKAHVALDFASGVAALAAPWLFGFAHHARARNTFLAMGVTGLVVSWLSGIFREPEEMPRGPYAARHKGARYYQL
jgi:hypothetical protein